LKKIAHFTITNPLGMHARVCSRWVKIMQKFNMLEYGEESILILYNNEKISATSLFKLLEARIPCSAEFDLLIKEEIEYSNNLFEELAAVITAKPQDVILFCQYSV
jgi:phosphotransferase system HPr-like phosphotransfer protein